MTILFVGGPYDGRELTPSEIETNATLITIRTRRGLRRFGYFPTLRYWGSGDVSKPTGRQSKGFHLYEFANTIEGPQYQYDQHGHRHREATDEAI